ncbi:MAG: hypothetical protein HFE43_09100 [Oscillospiraceae bacterium]|jgi:hypothetical protein|nr:hypothetical protein [Oscillospiraceae bacterium]
MNSFFPSDIPESTMNNVRSGGSITTPPNEDFNTNSMNGSIQQILNDNLGSFVVCDFLIGTENMVHKEGILYFVGRNYVTLYEEVSMTYIVCDIFSIKFITFYQPGRRPRNRPVVNNGYRQNGTNS